MKLSLDVKSGAVAALVAVLGIAGALVVRTSLGKMALDGRVVNYAGMVRGGAQRLTKLELAGKPADPIRARITGIIAGLEQGSAELNLPAAKTPEFVAAMRAVESQWLTVSGLIDQHRLPGADPESLLAESEKLFELSNTAVDRAEAAARQSVVRLQVVEAILAAAFVAIGVGMFLGVRRWICRPLMREAEFLAQSAEGTFGAASQVAAASASIAEASSCNAAAVEEAGASLEEMTQRLMQTCQDGTEARELAVATRKAAATGTRSVEELSAAMSQIRTAADQVAKIAGSIEEIAFQTNLLALNAAVEAARAGAAGRGFSVVADEVGKLARRASDAALESAMSIEDAIRSSEVGAASALKVSGALGELGSMVHHIDRHIDKIASAAAEQQRGIQTVRDAIRSIDSMTQANAAASNEEAAAANELQAQARVLQDHAADILTLVDGGQGSRTRELRGKPLEVVPAGVAERSECSEEVALASV